MRSTEYAPLFRSTIGFDRLFDMLENSVRTDWPPYNIEKAGENEYRIVMAIAGFGPDEVELTQHGSELTVTGQKKIEDNNRQLLHRGLTTGNFKQVFKLADYVTVAEASLQDGLLSIQLAREIPEQMKPRRITLTSEPQTAPIASPGTPEQISQDLNPKSKAA
jgi:molecular chaperone IbpA